VRDHLRRAHGLTVALPFRADELDAAVAGAPADVHVRAGPVPGRLGDARDRHDGYELSPSRYLLRGGDEGADFLVERGRKIRFRRGRLCDEATFRHQLFNPVIAAVVRQRRSLVLHASSAASDAGALVVTGQSGAGKSSTIAALAAQGWRLQGDDVAVLRRGPDGFLAVEPGVTQIRLYPHIAAALGWEAPSPPPPGGRKVIVAPPLPEKRQAQPLRRLVHLSAGDGDSVRVEQVSGRAKLPLMIEAIYGPMLASELDACFALYAEALTGVDILRVARPQRWAPAEVLAAVTAGFA
jgi:hypothetical protein